MKDIDKVKEQLLNELEKMRQEMAELEASETERKAGGGGVKVTKEKVQTWCKNENGRNKEICD
ncbi:MAG TPA: hypothetical protein VMW37_04455 [Dehalococcoidales bacterium]|nr:hypothetical protein [Dehalococcoidales bacterium]